ncbi:MAG TPA: hypothetical protein VGQ86_03350 [Candidatus Limnocylindria bacterium]|jgi:hypothetical protein|nr:hypothetical protein [Candidatus Limnocylindria bacterium]
MAVAPGAPPLDVALSRIAELIDDPRTVGDAVAALTCAALWRQVYEGASARGDDRVAALALAERRSALSVYRALTRVDPG